MRAAVVFQDRYCICFAPSEDLLFVPPEYLQVMSFFLYFKQENILVTVFVLSFVRRQRILPCFSTCAFIKLYKYLYGKLE